MSPALLPIRKIAAAALAGALMLLVQRLGLDLGPDQVNDAALYLVTVGSGYLARDPRVK